MISVLSKNNHDFCRNQAALVSNLQTTWFASESFFHGVPNLHDSLLWNTKLRNEFSVWGQCCSDHLTFRSSCFVSRTALEMTVFGLNCPCNVTSVVALAEISLCLFLTQFRLGQNRRALQMCVTVMLRLYLSESQQESKRNWPLDWCFLLRSSVTKMTQDTSATMTMMVRSKLYSNIVWFLPPVTVQMSKLH